MKHKKQDLQQKVKEHWASKEEKENKDRLKATILDKYRLKATILGMYLLHMRGQKNCSSHPKEKRGKKQQPFCFEPIGKNKIISHPQNRQIGYFIHLNS